MFINEPWYTINRNIHDISSHLISIMHLFTFFLNAYQRKETKIGKELIISQRPSQSTELKNDKIIELRPLPSSYMYGQLPLRTVEKCKIHYSNTTQLIVKRKTNTSSLGGGGRLMLPEW